MAGEEVSVASFESIERRLASHIDTTNEKLDQLIEVTKQMVAIQERQNRQTDDIRRFEDVQHRMTGMWEKFDVKINTVELDRKQVTQRLFDKIDEVLARKSAETLHMHEDVERDMAAVDKKLEKISDDLGNLSTDYHAKHNFTRGAIWVLGIALAIGQGVFINYLSDYNDQLSELKTYDKMNESREHENQQQVQLIQRQLSEVASRNKVRKTTEGAE